jgi:Bacterial protein of unknown function (DUF839)
MARLYRDGRRSTYITKEAVMRGHAAIVAILLGGSLVAGAGPVRALELTPVPSANAKAPGVVRPNVLSPELAEVVRAQGAMLVENPGLGDPAAPLYYGYNASAADLATNLLPLAPQTKEATKTEPDKNTYLVLEGHRGADARADYGTHFIFQGHEAGPGGRGAITRINLDADVAHRVTLLATTDVNGAPLPVFDGSTWYPFGARLLFTAENGNRGGVWQATLDLPSKVEDISGALGRGGYEGIQADSDGNLWIVEDVGGRNGSAAANLSHARQPNSFVYRFVPYDTRDLNAGGKLQVLAVASKAHAGTIVFNSANPDPDLLSQDILDLHTYGNVFRTTWITIHDTAVDGSAAFDANALAKGKGTPLKRPENGMFRPGTRFGEFYFTETADTDARTEAARVIGNGSFGGFGAIFKVTQRRPSDDHGTLTPFYLGDLDHTAFDNLAFLTKDQLVAVEDRGDTLHTQHNALDSAFLFDPRVDYANPANQPVRVLAQGRDPSATIDSGLLGTAGFQNEGDNEITGIHVSDGDPTANGILGAKNPHPFDGQWRVFYTQQHGDNQTFEIIPNPDVARDREDGDR